MNEWINFGFYLFRDSGGAIKELMAFVVDLRTFETNGLTLVQGLVEAHGGSARVSSSAREGTTFRISLPGDARPASNRGL